MIYLTNRLLFIAFLVGFLLFSTDVTQAQNQPSSPKTKSEFWQKVQFGGGLGLSFGNKYTDISIAPGAIYNFNEYVALGAGLQYSYIKQRDFYQSNLYGGSLLGLFHPIPQIQVSVEVEQLRANVSYEAFNTTPAFDDDFWSTGLFLGAGYRAGNVTIGARFNLLHDAKRNVYNEALMPFVRVYF